MKLKQIKYKDLNARQKETYNFQKVSALLADFGYATIKLNDDWNGADFIAQHINGKDYLKVQLKARLTFDKKYIGKGLYIAFPNDYNWYLYPHDKLLSLLLESVTESMAHTESWKINGKYTWKSISAKKLEILEKFLIPTLDKENI